MRHGRAVAGLWWPDADAAAARQDGLSGHKPHGAGGSAAAQAIVAADRP